MQGITNERIRLSNIFYIFKQTIRLVKRGLTDTKLTVDLVMVSYCQTDRVKNPIECEVKTISGPPLNRKWGTKFVNFSVRVNSFQGHASY